MKRSEGYGYDRRPQSRPGVPREAEPRVDPDSPWTSPPRQEPRVEHFHRVGYDALTPVFGTGQPPRGLSGALRRRAYRMPEHKARHWLMLLFADRVDVIEHRVPELLTGRTWGRLARQVKANPWLAAGTVGLLAGTVWMVRRAG